MCTILKIEKCPYREFIFSLRNYLHLLDSYEYYLRVVWVAYFGEELSAENKQGVWIFSKEDEYKYALIKRAYHYREFDEFDFVKNGVEKLREKMNSLKKLCQ